MSIDNKEPLIDYILDDDVIGAIGYLKEHYGVSEGFICNKANVNLSTYSLYKKGDIKILGADKKEALLNVIEGMYL